MWTFLWVADPIFPIWLSPLLLLFLLKCSSSLRPQTEWVHDMTLLFLWFPHASFTSPLHFLAVLEIFIKLCSTHSYFSVHDRHDYPFVGIECQNPYEHSIQEWNQVISSATTSGNSSPSVEWVLINSPHGFQVFPDANHTPTLAEFEEKILEPAIDYATQLKVPRIHLVMKDINNSGQKYDHHML